MDTGTTDVAVIHFGLAWNWEYDRDFVHLLDRACGQTGLRSYLVGPHNLRHTAQEVERGTRGFLWFLDRASDEDDRFLAFNRLLESHGTRFLNAHHHYRQAIDKANLHHQLLARGLDLPQTVVLAPYDAAPDLDPRLVEGMTKPFVVKPAKGSGGRGVLVGATRAEDVTRTRAAAGQQRVLLQQHVEPQILDGRRAWFRVYHVCGQVIPCWWDDVTHRYAPVTAADETVINARELARIIRIVAEVSQLEFFSSEIALDRNGRYLVVDYVNDPCDMRAQSKCDDGVPDAVIQQVVAAIVSHVARHCAAPPAGAVCPS